MEFYCTTVLAVINWKPIKGTVHPKNYILSLYWPSFHSKLHVVIFHSMLLFFYIKHKTIIFEWSSRQQLFVNIHYDWSHDLWGLKGFHVSMICTILHFGEYPLNVNSVLKCCSLSSARIDFIHCLRFDLNKNHVSAWWSCHRTAYAVCVQWWHQGGTKVTRRRRIAE